MLLGIIGPALIVFHSGYRLGSLNGRIAFFSMVIVALSGLIGRYLYRRIHHGLYGEKIKFEELHQIDASWVEKLPQADKGVSELASELSEIEAKLTTRHTGINRSYLFYSSMRGQLKRIQKRINRQISNSNVQQFLSVRVSALRSICRLGIHEILFSAWHILHFPLFIMLVISGLTHVVVVHFY
jgi:hypothetical protein